MSGFIKLTHEDGRAIYVAVDKIEALTHEIRPGSTVAVTLVLTAAAEAYRVVESVEDILKNLKAGWC